MGGEKKYKRRILVSCQNFIVGRSDDIHVYFLWGIHAAVMILLIYVNGCMMNSELLQQAPLSTVNIYSLQRFLPLVILALHFI